MQQFKVFQKLSTIVTYSYHLKPLLTLSFSFQNILRKMTRFVETAKLTKRLKVNFEVYKITKIVTKICGIKKAAVQSFQKLLAMCYLLMSFYGILNSVIFISKQNFNRFSKNCGENT